MNDLLYESRNKRDGVTIPTIWVAIALSVLVHVAALWKWLPKLDLRLPSLEELQRGEAGGSLVVHLAPPVSPPQAAQSSPVLRSQPSSTPQSRAPRAVARAQPPLALPEIALNRPAPEAASPPPVAPRATAPAPVRPPEGDLSSYVEARRRARNEAPQVASQGSISSAPPVEDDKSRTNRIVASNLGTNRTPTFGSDPTKHGGGIFQIERLGYTDAEFLFYGWNKDIRRNTIQRIEVRKGENSDIRIAVVRKMIAIIREYEQEDFLWESRRLGRNLTLSARARDNAGLEEFMLREFPEFGYGSRLPQ
jgi:hypothetical protein